MLSLKPTISADLATWLDFSACGVRRRVTYLIGRLAQPPLVKVSRPFVDRGLYASAQPRCKMGERVDIVIWRWDAQLVACGLSLGCLTAKRSPSASTHTPLHDTTASHLYRKASSRTHSLSRDRQRTRPAMRAMKQTFVMIVSPIDTNPSPRPSSSVLYGSPPPPPPPPLQPPPLPSQSGHGEHWAA